jgi:hypothetical protein
MEVLKMAAPNKLDDSFKSTDRAWTLTSHCRTLAQEVHHAFSMAEFDALAKNPAVKVIVEHGGIHANPSFRLLNEVEERAPIFVHQKRNITDLSSGMLKKMLCGEVTDWTELGSDEGKINLHLHGGRLQKKAFETLFKTIPASETSVSELSRETFHHPSYETLASAAARDTKALVVGLREIAPNGLKPLSIDGVALSLEMSQPYPLSMPVGVFVRKDALTPKDLASLSDALKQEL